MEDWTGPWYAGWGRAWLGECGGGWGGVGGAQGGFIKVGYGDEDPKNPQPRDEAHQRVGKGWEEHTYEAKPLVATPYPVFGLKTKI